MLFEQASGDQTEIIDVKGHSLKPTMLYLHLSIVSVFVVLQNPLRTFLSISFTVSCVLHNVKRNRESTFDLPERKMHLKITHTELMFWKFYFGILTRRVNLLLGIKKMRF